MSAVLEQILAEIGSAYLIVNRTLCIQLLGGRTDILNPVPTVGDALLDLFPELVGSEALLDEILMGRSARLYLQRINRDGHDGSIRYFDLLTLPHMDASGQIGGLIQVITDVTEHGVMEQLQMQQRNELRLLKDRITRQNIQLARTNVELRHASRLKDEFLAGISHEVRTPLSSILGMTELLHTHMLGTLNEEQTDMLRRIEESGRHLLTVINDLLDLAKIEAGQFDIDLNPASARHLCDASVRMVNQLALRKGHTIQMQIDPRVMVIRVDERRMRQVLINLLMNAIKFTPPGGRLGLDVQGDPAAEVVRFTVWDTGIGIADEDIPRLFQPFSQIDGAYQREQTGSGLGLVMVTRLAELQGGGVELSSEPGVGSRFTVSLPWCRDEQQHNFDVSSLGETAAKPGLPNEPEPLPHTERDESILLIEDDATGAAVVADYLGCCGYRVTHVGSGDEALAYVRVDLPDLMIVDLRMRGIDGLETIRQMRAGIATSAIPIIVLTALVMPGTRERCFEAGADIYLTKPVRLHHLAERVAALLAERVSHAAGYPAGPA